MINKKVIYIFTLLVLLVFISFVFNQYTVANSHFKIDGWEHLEKTGKVELWQKIDESGNYISENILNSSIAVGCDVLKGYTIKLKNDVKSFDPACDDFPLGFWKLVYYGFDTSGNIHFKLYCKKNNLSAEEQIRLIKEIKTIIAADKEREDGYIISRQRIFTEILKDYFEKDGERLVIDPGKTFVVFGIDNAPAIKLEVLSNNNIIIAQVEPLE